MCRALYLSLAHPLPHSLALCGIPMSLKHYVCEGDYYYGMPLYRELVISVAGNMEFDSVDIYFLGGTFYDNKKDDY